MGEAAVETSLVGRKNIYCCEDGHYIVTVDRDEGVTPFMTPFMTTCKAPGCKKHMQSSMYRVFDQRLAATHEWYRPGAIEVLSPGEQQHVDQGGMLLRNIRSGRRA